MLTLDSLTNFSFLRSAPRLERSSFFVDGKAMAKIAGVEGGNRRPKYSIQHNFNLIFALITFSKKYFFIDLIDELLLQR